MTHNIITMSFVMISLLDNSPFSVCVSVFFEQSNRRHSQLIGIERQLRRKRIYIKISFKKASTSAQTHTISRHSASDGATLSRPTKLYSVVAATHSLLDTDSSRRRQSAREFELRLAHAHFPMLNSPFRSTLRSFSFFRGKKQYD